MKAIEDREIEILIGKQEAVGLKSITDGENRRKSWQTDFISALPGIETVPHQRKVNFQGGVQPQQVLTRVARKLGDFSTHPMIEHFKFVKAHTKQTAKMTIPSPSAVHFRDGREAVPESIYPDMDEFYHDLGQTYRKAVRAFADAGCRYLQLDEVNLTYLCDEKLIEKVRVPWRGPRCLAQGLCGDDQRRDVGYSRRHGHHHASVPRQFPLHLHRLRRLRAGGRRDVQHHQRPWLFHGVRQRPRRRVRALRFVPKGKTVVLGLVTSKTGRSGIAR